MIHGGLTNDATNLSMLSDSSRNSEENSSIRSEILQTSNRLHDQDLSTNLETSIGSIPLLEQTPIVADITTPNVSLQSSILLENTDNDSSQEISKPKPEGEIYRTSRPKTDVFSQGKVFTYEKLEIESSKGTKGTKSTFREKPVMPAADRESPNQKVPLLCLDKPTKITHGKVGYDAFTILKNIRIENLKNVIIGQLNINSLRNKIHGLAEFMRGNLDILVLTETKLDHTFPTKQFLIPGYRTPFRADRNKDGGGVMIYVREDIPCDILLKHIMPGNVEAILVEINLRKNKLLLVGTYHSKNPKYGASDVEFFKHIGLALDVYSSRFDKFLLAGDFNTEEGNETLDEFLEDYHAKNLVKVPTCFKSLPNPSCIDLFVTNSYRSFQKTQLSLGSLISM